MTATRRALLASLLIALTVAAGQALAGIPNVELVTFFVFVSGFILGARGGAIVGGAAMGAHSLFNPMGAVVPPMLVVQVVCYATIGASGGLAGPVIARAPPAIGALLSAFLAIALVLFYQVAINVTAFYTFTASDTLWIFVWGGIAFTGLQLGWNAALFLLAMRPTLAVLARHRVLPGSER